MLRCLRFRIFQSTLPCGSDSGTHVSSRRALTISIHAPLRERPIRGTGFKKRRFISIHAPLRERLAVWSMYWMSAYFNPRSLAGATLAKMLKRKPKLFQSTLPCGSDSRAFLWPRQRTGFQSTLPCGSDVTS